MQAELSRYFCSLYRIGQGPFIGRAAILAASSKANAEITEGARRARDSPGLSLPSIANVRRAASYKEPSFTVKPSPQ